MTARVAHRALTAQRQVPQASRTAYRARRAKRRRQERSRAHNAMLVQLLTSRLACVRTAPSDATLILERRRASRASRGITFETKIQSASFATPAKRAKQSQSHATIVMLANFHTPEHRHAYPVAQADTLAYARPPVMRAPVVNTPTLGPATAAHAPGARTPTPARPRATSAALVSTRPTAPRHASHVA